MTYSHAHSRLFFHFICTLNETDDWSSLVGNFGKLGLGLLSIFFDVIFLVQHYLLYSENNLHVFQTSSISSIQIDCDGPGKQISSHKNANHDNNNKASNSCTDCLLNDDK